MNWKPKPVTYTGWCYHALITLRRLPRSFALYNVNRKLSYYDAAWANKRVCEFSLKKEAKTMGPMWRAISFLLLRIRAC